VDIDGAKLHYHRQRSTELYYVLEGSGTVSRFVLAWRRRCKRARWSTSHPGVIHGAKGQMRVLVVGIPDIAEDDYFAQVAQS